MIIGIDTSLCLSLSGAKEILTTERRQLSSYNNFFVQKCVCTIFLLKANRV